VPALGEVANFGTDYFLSKIKFLARNKREFTTKSQSCQTPVVCCVYLNFSNSIASSKYALNFSDKI
ncbi:hypothetical protein KBJ98_15175, partial [Flavobacterium sp. F-328]